MQALGKFAKLRHNRTDTNGLGQRMAPALKTLPVSHLNFDPENPRLPERVDGEDAAAVTDFFLLECNLIELMMSIAEQGYFHGEPLLVVPDANGGTHTVVEGNRRLASLKLLTEEISPHSMEKAVAKILVEAKEKPTDVPCLIFNAREEVLKYLGYRHITGIKEWDALAKARYLAQLRTKVVAADHAEAHRILAKEIGSKSNAVAKILTGYNLLNYAKDEGIQIEDSNHSTAVFNNSGTVNITTPADHGMELFGTFNNLTGGTYQVTGAIDDGIRMRDAAVFNNDGAIIISGIFVNETKRNSFASFSGLAAIAISTE